MKRIIPVLGTSMLFAFAIGAQAEQALTGGQMDVITAGNSEKVDQSTYQVDPCQGTGCQGESDPHDWVQNEIDKCSGGGSSCTQGYVQELVKACPTCTLAPEKPVCENDPGKGKAGKHPHHGKRHIVKRHGGKHHGGKRHGGKHHGGWVIAKMGGCGGSTCGGGKMPPAPPKYK